MPCLCTGSTVWSSTAYISTSVVKGLSRYTCLSMHINLSLLWQYLDTAAKEWALGIITGGCFDLQLDKSVIVAWSVCML